MMSVMMVVMAQTNFATSLPEHAVAILRDRAKHDNMTLSAWLARAIYDKATRDGAKDSVDDLADAERRRFLEESEADRARQFHVDARQAAA